MGWNWHRIAIWAFALAFLVYMVIVPTTEWILESISPPETGQKSLDGPTLSEQVRMRTIEGMIALIFFSIGAAVGSFLNVVVFRMPRGQSVVFKASSCPGCGLRIESRDNIPILGWLLLNGKCRNCKMPISSRYPIVELIVGAIFLLFYFAELISGGDNIPVRHPNGYRGVVWIIFYTKWDLVSLYFFHCFAISALMSWALIDIDRHRIREQEFLKPEFQPTRIPLHAKVGACFVLLLLPCLLPHLQPVPWQLDTAMGFETSRWMSSVGTGVLGGLIGGALGWIALLLTTTEASCETVGKSGEDEENSIESKAVVKKISFVSHTISAGAIVGLSVGWQAAIGVWLIAFAFRPVTCLVARKWNVNEPPMTVVLLVAYLVHLLAWRFLTVPWWPSYATTTAAWGIAAVVMALLIGANRILRCDLEFLPDNHGEEKNLDGFSLDEISFEESEHSSEVYATEMDTNLQDREKRTHSQNEIDPAEESEL